MFESEDGTVTGSIDRSKLGDLNPKTDEAKEQVERLRAENEAADKESAAAAERSAELAAAQNPVLQRQSRAGNTRQDQSQREQQGASGQQAQADQQQQDEVTRLQAEAEQAGVTVDKRWGADRLRQEIDTAKAAQASRKRG